MNDNTILRIKVPANLYESVKKQLSLTEAKKQNFGAGYSVVKEKKMNAPKDVMETVEEADTEMKDADKKMKKKTRTLDELKAAKDKLDKKIEEMSSKSKEEKPLSEDALEESPVMDAVAQFLSSYGPEALMAAMTAGGAGLGTYLSKKEKETGKSQLPKTTAFRGR
jgi:hypothetical protein